MELGLRVLFPIDSLKKYYDLVKYLESKTLEDNEGYDNLEKTIFSKLINVDKKTDSKNTFMSNYCMKNQSVQNINDFCSLVKEEAEKQAAAAAGGKMKKGGNTSFSRNLKKFLKTILTCINSDPNQVVPFSYPTTQLTQKSNAQQLTQISNTQRPSIAWEDTNKNIEIYAFVNPLNQDDNQNVNYILPVVIIQPNGEVTYGKPITNTSIYRVYNLSNDQIQILDHLSIAKVFETQRIFKLEGYVFASQIPLLDTDNKQRYVLTFRLKKQDENKMYYKHLFSEIPIILPSEKKIYIVSGEGDTTNITNNTYSVYEQGEETKNYYYELKIDKSGDKMVIKFIKNGEEKDNLLNYITEFKGVRVGGSSKEYISILGRKRLVKKQGRTKYITYKGELIKLSEAKKLAKNKK